MDEIDKELGLLPAMFVGVGGTGAGIVNRLHSRFMQSPLAAEKGNAFHFFVMDTHEGDGTEMGAEMRVGAERSFLFTNIDGNDFVEKFLTQDDEFEKWWPRDEKNRPYMPGYIDHGANGIRPKGRLAFKCGLETTLGRTVFYDSLRDGIRKTFDLQRELRFPDRYQRQQAVRVYVCAGLSGGTGSSMFIDVANLIRHVFESQQMQVKVIGVLALSPLACMQGNETDHRHFRRTAYAALRELDLYQGAHTPKEFGYTMNAKARGFSIRRRPEDRPFDYCFLVGDKNVDNRFLPSFPVYLDFVASYLFHGACDPGVTQRVLGVLNNFENRIAESVEGHPASYGGFGIGILSFPKESVGRYMARKFLVEFQRTRVRQENYGQASDLLGRALKLHLKMESLEQLRERLRQATRVSSQRPQLAVKGAGASEFDDLCRQAEAQRLEWQSDLSKRLSNDAGAQLAESIKADLLAYLPKAFETAGANAMGVVAQFLDRLGTEIISNLLTVTKRKLREASAQEEENSANFEGLRSTVQRQFKRTMARLLGLRPAEDLARLASVFQDWLASKQASSELAVIEAALGDLQLFVRNMLECVKFVRGEVLGTKVKEIEKTLADTLVTREGGTVLSRRGFEVNVLCEPHLVDGQVYARLVGDAPEMNNRLCIGMTQMLLNEVLRPVWDALANGKSRDAALKDLDPGRIVGLLEDDCYREFSRMLEGISVWDAMEWEALADAGDKTSSDGRVQQMDAFVSEKFRSLKKLAAPFLQVNETTAAACGFPRNWANFLVTNMDDYTAFQSKYKIDIVGYLGGSSHCAITTGGARHSVYLVHQTMGYPLFGLPAVVDEANRDEYVQYHERKGWPPLHSDRRFYTDKGMLRIPDIVPDEFDADPLIFLLCEQLGHIQSVLDSNGNDTGTYRYFPDPEDRETYQSLPARGSGVKGREAVLRAFNEKETDALTYRRLREVAMGHWRALGDSDSKRARLQELIKELERRKLRTKGSLSDCYSGGMDYVQDVLDRYVSRDLAVPEMES